MARGWSTGPQEPGLSGSCQGRVLGSPSRGSATLLKKGAHCPPAMEPRSVAARHTETKAQYLVPPCLPSNVTHNPSPLQGWG